MKGIVSREDLVSAASMRRAVTPRQLDGGFVGFRAAVTKKNAIRERMAAKLPRQLGLRHNVVEIGNMQKFAGLLLDGADDGRVTVAQVVYGDAGQKVEILLAVSVPHPGAFTANQGDGIARVRLRDVFVRKLDDFAVFHH
jgi:hypothetical protein